MEPSELAAVAGRYRDMIYRVALHWCGHPQEAEDATQDTLLKLCATHRTFADEEHLKSWLIQALFIQDIYTILLSIDVK